MSDFFQTMFGGTNTPQTQNLQGAGGQLNQLAAQFQRAYPQISQSILSQAAPQASTAYNLYQQYAPQLNTLGQQMSAANQAAQAASTAGIMGSPAASGIVNSTNALQQLLNPQFYQLRGQVGQGESNLLNTLAPPGQLSGSSQAQIERGLNQMNYGQGNANVGNPLTTLMNAQNFGQGLQQQQQFQSGLFNQAANTGANTQSGLSAFGLVNPTQAPTQFGGTSSALNATPSTNQLGGGLFSGLLGLQGNTNAANAGMYGSQLGAQTASSNTGQQALSPQGAGGSMLSACV